MSFKVDTGFALGTVTGQIDNTQSIRIATRLQAQRITGKVRSAIEAHEDHVALAVYWAAEDIVLDALHLFDPHLLTDLREVYETHRAALMHGGVNRIVPDDPRRTEFGTAQKAQFGKDGKEKDWFDEL